MSEMKNRKSKLPSLQPIRNEEDYRNSLALLERFGFLEEGEDVDRDDFVHALGVLVQDYENEHYPMPLSDPIDTIKARLVQMDWLPGDLAVAAGLSKSKVSEILSRKRRMSLDAIRKISNALGLSLELLAQEYSTEQSEFEDIADETEPPSEAMLHGELGTIAFEPRSGRLWPVSELTENRRGPDKGADDQSTIDPLDKPKTRKGKRKYTGHVVHKWQRGGYARGVGKVKPVGSAAFISGSEPEPLSGTWVSARQLRTLAQATEDGAQGFLIVNAGASASLPDAWIKRKRRQLVSTAIVGAGVGMVAGQAGALALGCVYAGWLDDFVVQGTQGAGTPAESPKPVRHSKKLKAQEKDDGSRAAGDVK